MRFEIHAAGTRSSATLLGEFATFRETAIAFASGPIDGREPWSIVPIGSGAELEGLGNLDSIAPRYPLGKHGDGVYVTRCGDGVSCLGFAYAERIRAAVGEWLAKEGQRPSEARRGLSLAEPGSPDAYRRYLAVMAQGAAYSRASGTRCPAELTPQLNGLEGKRVEVVDCYGERRRFYVGKSTGWLPIHLEIARRNSSGGGGVTGAPFRSLSIIGAR